jgi:LysW-gamma-L-lysine carboxypeptidase
LLGLVSRYSPTGKEAEAVEWLVERMDVLGYSRAFVDPGGNAVGVLGEGPRQALLLGHIDTVPGEITPRLEGGKLYGRGSVDAKGSLAAFVDAAAQAGALPGWQIVVVGAVDEEGDSAGARCLISDYRPEWVIVGEPSRWDRVTLGYKGSAWAEVSVRVPLSHTAGPEQGACERAVAVWQRAQDWAERYNAGKARVFDQVQLTLKGLSSQEDGFEEQARLRIGARLPALLTPEAWYAELERQADQAEVQPVGYAVPAYRAEKNTALVRAFLAAIRAAGESPATPGLAKPGLGFSGPSFTLKTGTSDLNIVAPAWNCPAVAYGPGDSALDHTPDEHLDLEDYSRAADVLVRVLRRMGDL